MDLTSLKQISTINSSTYVGNHREQPDCDGAGSHRAIAVTGVFPGDTVMFGKVKASWLLAAILGVVMCQASAGAEPDRKVVKRVKPAYPELARQMNVSGTVKIEVVIAANGTVKSMKALGGHPLLIQSASEALKKWRFAPGLETTTIVEFQFHTTD
jgi:TonB family protein